ncbi:hypothetical protein HGRIS_008248 [Hohenbuehelia grisea]|uniref:Uncharacterized protein n=1 Tax=Hohenbuehelia grisea TaxID=104357 RepID=A0ABR3J896_9AGAR
MSTKAVRTHTHASNRAKQTSDQKVVFKSVLDNPYRVTWSPVPVNLQNALLAQLISGLDGLAEYNTSRWAENRKRKRSTAKLGRADEPKKRRTMTDAGSKAAEEILSLDIVCLDKPEILQHLFVGINDVTRRLETQVREARQVVKAPAEHTPASTRTESRQDIAVLFVCKDDMDPPLLTNHLPHLVAAHNSVKKTDPIKLVPLPKGSEASLAAAFGLRRLAVIGMDSYPPLLEPLRHLLDSVPVLRTPWLSTNAPPLIPTHIKQVRTSAPVDMKASKEKRVEGRRAAKERRLALG